MKLSHRKKRKIKKALRVTGGLFAVVAFFTTALLLIHRWELKQTVELPPQETEGDLYYGGAWYDLRQDVETLLFFGVDKYEGQLREGVFTNDQQADFLLLLVRDKSQNVCRALPLNRDTMTKITQLDLSGLPMGGQVEQLALAHTYGSGGEDSGRNTARAVSDLLYGVPVDHYVGMSMDAVAVLTDAVGGVPVMVEQDFSQVTDALPMGQETVLTGQLALQFVRARGGVGEQTNVERMSRQQQFMESFYPLWQEKCRADDGFLADVLLDVADYITTDCSLETLSVWQEQMADCELTLMEPPAGEAVVGERFMEFYAEEKPLRETVIGLFYEKCA